MVLWLTCGLTAEQAKMLMNSKSSPVSHTMPLKVFRTEFPQCSLGGIPAVIWVVVEQVYGHRSCSTSAVPFWCVFDCELAVFWTIPGAENSKNLFSPIGLCTWRNIQHKSDLILLQEFEGNRVI